MIDRFERRELAGLAAAFGLAVAVAFGAGTFLGGGVTGAVASDGAASTDTVESNVQQFMDRQVQAQAQQFQMMAEQSPNLSADDLSMDASVTDVSLADFGGLYEVTVSISGQVPGRTGGLQSIDREQTLYVSQNGQYMFSQPTDLTQQRQQPTLPQ